MQCRIDHENISRAWTKISAIAQPRRTSSASRGSRDCSRRRLPERSYSCQQQGLHLIAFGIRANRRATMPSSHGAPPFEGVLDGDRFYLAAECFGALEWSILPAKEFMYSTRFHCTRPSASR